MAITDYVDVQPGSIAQVHRSLRGVNVAIADDVQGIAQDLLDISPDLRLTYNPHEAVWIVWQEIPLPDGATKEHLVTTTVELDKRLVNVVRRCCSESYRLADELEAAEARADRENEHKRMEILGDAAEKLDHALRKDLSRHENPRTLKSKAFIPAAFTPEG